MLSTMKRRIAVIAAVFTICGGMVTATGIASASEAAQVLSKAPSWTVGENTPRDRQVVPPPSGKFISYAPTRLLDTRDKAPLGPDQHGKLHFNPKSLPANAIAVVLNLTGTEPSEGTYLAVTASGVKPTISSLNLRAHETRANQVTSRLSADGSIDIYNKNGFTHVVADLAGFYVSEGDNAVGYAPVSPTRLADTRNLGHIASGQTIEIDLRGKIPDTATAITVNLTGVDATNNTFLSLYPSGTERPLASTLNLVAGETTPNLTTVNVGADRRIKLYNNYGVADAAVDLLGYYDPASTAEYVPLDAGIRIEDSRVNGVPIGGDGIRSITATPPKDEPRQVVSLLVNITAVNGTWNPTFLTAWGNGDRPYTSNVNLAKLQTASNAANVPAADNAKFNLYNAFGSVNDIVDFQGYFAKS